MCELKGICKNGIESVVPKPVDLRWLSVHRPGGGLDLEICPESKLD